MVRILVIAVLVGAALAQNSTPPENNGPLAAAIVTGAAKDPVEPVAAVAPGDLVLTIHGICFSSESPVPANANGCTVLVKRRQFDNLMKIVAPGAQVTTASKQRLAKTYTDLIAFDSAARKSGIDNTAQFRETMEWLRLRTLADLYRRSLEKESSTVSEQEIDEYYHQHLPQFEEVKLRRILLPRNSFADPDKQEFERKALHTATEIRQRASKGEDLDQLQKEAYLALGFNVLPPASEVGYRRRASLAPEVSEDIFATPPGEVSPVEKEAYSFVIYKVEAKRALPEPQVREEIKREISKQKLEGALKSVTADVRTDMNDKYFGAPAEQ